MILLLYVDGASFERMEVFIAKLKREFLTIDLGDILFSWNSKCCLHVEVFFCLKQYMLNKSFEKQR